MPSIQRMWEKLHGDGLEVLAVNVGEDSQAVTQFLAEFETSIEFPVLLDENGEAFQQWRVLGLPQTFVIDKKGRMIYEASGGRDMDSDHIGDRLMGLLKE
jgi:peroxiredoxin